MAGYSGTPLVKKLGIKEDHRVGLAGAPAGFERTLGSLPAGAMLENDGAGKGSFNVIVFFAKDLTTLKKSFVKLARRLEPDGGLWVGWPKKASRVPTDLDENIVRDVGLAAGLVDNKVCAIDETWSGLRFVVRLRDRPRKTV